MADELYIECKAHGCTAPLQGPLETHTAPDGKIVSFSGVCTNGHTVGHGLSKDNQIELAMLGWRRPGPGEHSTFVLPVVQPRRNATMTIQVPEDPDTDYALVNLKDGSLTPLPKATIVRRLAGPDDPRKGQLIELSIVLGEGVKQKKRKRQAEEKASNKVAQETAKARLNPFKESSDFYDAVQHLITEGKISEARFNRMTSRDWQVDRSAKYLNGKGMNVVARNGFVRMA